MFSPGAWIKQGRYHAEGDLPSSGIRTTPSAEPGWNSACLNLLLSGLVSESEDGPRSSSRVLQKQLISTCFEGQN